MGKVILLLDNQNSRVGLVFKDFSEVEWEEINESINAAQNLAQDDIIKLS